MKKTILLMIPIMTIIALAGCASSRKERSYEGLYKSAEAKDIAFTSYDAALELWPVEFEEVWVDTPFGSTHIVVSGKADGKPVFFLPGLFGDATMWYANVGEIAREYRVYCPDLPTFGGKSEPNGVSIEDIGDYRVWFESILTHFTIDSVAVAGLSYGSWLSLALARETPGSISAVIMLDPSETFTKMDGGIAWRGFWSFAVFPNRSKYESFFNWLGGGYTDEENDSWFQHMLDVIQYGSVGMFDVPQHRIYHAEDLSMITMPVLVMAGGKPILYKDPGKFAAAAKEAIPHAEVVIVPGTGHSLNVEKRDEVNARVMDFLSANYR